jgi:hypothetical protein
MANFTPLSLYIRRSSRYPLAKQACWVLSHFVRYGEVKFFLLYLESNSEPSVAQPALPLLLLSIPISIKRISVRSNKKCTYTHEIKYLYMFYVNGRFGRFRKQRLV